MLEMLEEDGAGSPGGPSEVGFERQLGMFQATR